MTLVVEIDPVNRKVVRFVDSAGFASGEIYDPVVLKGIRASAAANLTLLLTDPATGTQLASVSAGGFTATYSGREATLHLDTQAMLDFFPTPEDGKTKVATLEVRDADQVFCVCPVDVWPSPTAAAQFTPQNLLDAVRRSDFAALSALPADFSENEMRTLVNNMLDLLKNGA